MASFSLWHPCSGSWGSVKGFNIPRSSGIAFASVEPSPPELRKGYWGATIFSVPCLMQILIPWVGFGRKREPSLLASTHSPGGEPQQKTARGRRRNTEALLLLGRKPSTWDLGRVGAPCSWLQQSGVELLPRWTERRERRNLPWFKYHTFAFLTEFS